LFVLISVRNESAKDSENDLYQWFVSGTDKISSYGALLASVWMACKAAAEGMTGRRRLNSFAQNQE